MGELDFVDEKIGAANRRAARAQREAARAKMIILEIEAWLARPPRARLTEPEFSIWLQTHWPVQD